jgi:hypothetical protein
MSKVQHMVILCPTGAAALAVFPTTVMVVLMVMGMP